MLFFVSLLVDGILAGAVYALIALAFVVVYKASGMINFALGEWVMYGSRLAAVGLHAAGLGPAGALAFAGAGMVALALAFNRVVLRRLVGRPLISVIMVTLGLGAVMRGLAPLLFGGIPAAFPLPISEEPLVMHGIRIAPARVVALVVAGAAIAAVGAFFRWSRTGVALRALADDQQVALSMGIDEPDALFVLELAEDSGAGTPYHMGPLSPEHQEALRALGQLMRRYADGEYMPPHSWFGITEPEA